MLTATLAILPDGEALTSEKLCFSKGMAYPGGVAGHLAALVSGEPGCRGAENVSGGYHARWSLNSVFRWRSRPAASASVKAPSAPDSEPSFGGMT